MRSQDKNIPLWLAARNLKRSDILPLAVPRYREMRAFRSPRRTTTLRATGLAASLSISAVKTHPPQLRASCGIARSLPRARVTLGSVPSTSHKVDRRVHGNSSKAGTSCRPAPWRSITTNRPTDTPRTRQRRRSAMRDLSLPTRGMPMRSRGA